MGDTAMKSDSERNEGGQQMAYMIPGVDGKLQFGFPKKIITILRYYQSDVLTSNLGSIANTVFRMNSLFDPDFTGTGHQPMYYDRYAALYSNYRVLGSRLSTTFYPTHDATAVSNGPYIIGMHKSHLSSSLASSLDAVQEQNDTFSQLIGGGDAYPTLSITFSPEIDLGRPALDDVVSSDVLSSPSDIIYATPFFTDRTNATGSTVHLNTCIEFTVEFFDLKVENAS